MKEYIKPQLEVIEYSLDDVISASPTLPETGMGDIAIPTGPFFEQ